MRHRIVLPGLLTFLALTAPVSAAPKPSDLEFFENKVRPVLVEHCYSCHAGKKERGGLKVDSLAALLKGGDTGPALVPGKPEQSLLIKAVRHHGDLKMPPKGKLPEAVAANLAKWIERGAAAPDVKTSDAVKGIDWTAARTFWSFQPVRRPALPAVKNTAWPRNDLDRFILARLEAEELAPVSEADRRTLLRRATFDLTGLPPTPEEVDAFVKDSHPDAWKRVVDRLLASPHYGERWARHWLDVARYAEDQAHTFGVKPNSNAWRYRDWVIAAFNNDMPYDRFVKLQIAADLIEEKRAGKAQSARRARLLWSGGAILQELRRRPRRRGRTRRPRRYAGPRLPGADRGLRPLSRSQVRPHSDAGLLLLGRRLPILPPRRGPARRAGRSRSLSAHAGQVPGGRAQTASLPHRRTAQSWRRPASINSLPTCCPPGRCKRSGRRNLGSPLPSRRARTISTPTPCAAWSNC